MRMYLRISLLTVLTSLLLAGCEKEDKPVVLPVKNDSAYLLSASMGDDYRKEVFVNVQTGQTWSADIDSWDLQLESSPEGYLIKMNGGKKVLIGVTGYTNIRNLMGTIQFLRWDNASGMKDSIVLGNWADPVSHISKDSVYFIDRGDNCRRDEQFFQFQIKSVDANKYTLRIANLDGGNVHDVDVMKDQSKLNVYFSFEHGGHSLNIEPDKNSWHFCFLRYRWIYYEFHPALLYTVSGVHINTGKVEVAVDSSLKFESIKLNDVLAFHYRDVRDVIGYDWKAPDFSSGVATPKYYCRKNVNFIIRDKQSVYTLFKLHFIGFYDQHGVKGSPQFEVEQL